MVALGIGAGILCSIPIQVGFKVHVWLQDLCMYTGSRTKVGYDETSNALIDHRLMTWVRNVPSVVIAALDKTRFDGNLSCYDQEAIC